MADHLTAEYGVKTEDRGRTVDEWKPRAGSPDNYWFDCLVGCAAARYDHDRFVNVTRTLKTTPGNDDDRA